MYVYLSSIFLGQREDLNSSGAQKFRPISAHRNAASVVCHVKYNHKDMKWLICGKITDKQSNMSFVKLNIGSKRLNTVTIKSHL